MKKRTLFFAVLGMLSCIVVAYGQVSESELGEPGAAAPAFPPPTIERPPAQKTAPPPAAPEPAPAPKAEAAPKSAPAPAPATATEVHERNRVQSGKPVAAFWTVMPGR